MTRARIDIAGIRRREIIEAAVAVITEQGLQNLSLSEIEKKADMSRGQLTYYFATKEDILLAVFDHVVGLMHARIGAPAGGQGEQSGWGWVEHLLGRLLGEPPLSKEFACLQYTFLAQIAHREDFRERLAGLYETWRGNLAEGLAADSARGELGRHFSPRAVSCLVQAMLHGLRMQLAADPEAFDREEMLHLCLDVLGNYLRVKPRHGARSRRPARRTNGTPRALPARPGRRAHREDQS
ncbi:MAG TPA: TetR/AcrR family transcriptional regulator [Gemmataceae bacterium]|nr:TetR/AcrR family transcriptional regulator [Gemmataceae bacterium]